MTGSIIWRPIGKLIRQNVGSKRKVNEVEEE